MSSTMSRKCVHVEIYKQWVSRGPIQNLVLITAPAIDYTGNHTLNIHSSIFLRVIFIYIIEFETFIHTIYLNNLKHRFRI